MKRTLIILASLVATVALGVTVDTHTVTQTALDAKSPLLKILTVTSAGALNSIPNGSVSIGDFVSLSPGYPTANSFYQVTGYNYATGFADVLKHPAIPADIGAATSAQGAKADAALPATGGTVSGSLVLNGTHNPAPNQVGVTPNDADLISKSQASALYVASVAGGSTPANYRAQTGHIIAWKAAETSRASTTTLADDPDLKATLEANKTYRIYGVMTFRANGSVSGLTSHMNYTGGDFSYAGGCSSTGLNNSPGVAFGRPAASSSDLQVPFHMFQCDYSVPGNGTGWARVDAIFKTVAAGVLSLQWAQTTADTTPVTVNAGSFFMLEKLD